MRAFTIKAEPFSWNENLSEVALEDFSMIQKSLSYCTCQTIGMALAKLELMEKKGLNPDTAERILRLLEDEKVSIKGCTREEDEKLVRHWNDCIDVCTRIIKEEVG